MYLSFDSILFLYYMVIFLYNCYNLSHFGSFIQTKDLKGIPFNLLVPGMMVNARVLSTLENGILLSFLTFFTGTVSLQVSTVYLI